METKDKNNSINDGIEMLDKIAEQKALAEQKELLMPKPDEGPTLEQIEEFKKQFNQKKVDFTPPVTPAPTNDFTKQNYENYWEINNLPSKGLFYDGAKLLARPLNVSEIKLLSSISENNVNQVINQVITRVVKGIDVQEIMVADKLFIILWLRANTYKDDSYKVPFECYHCKSETEYHFNIDQLEITYINEDLRSIPEKTTTSGKRFRCRYLRVKDENNVSDFLSSYKGMEKFDEEILDMAEVVESINGNKDLTLLQKYYYLKQDCDAQDFAYIDSFIQYIDFGVNPIMEIKCEKCGGISPVAISFRSDFFIPKISFG